jgi:hypothetical protein
MPEGRLIVWADITGDYEENRAWTQTEHIPERLAVPGFLWCRRFRGISPGSPNDMNIYRTISPSVFTSPEYVARLTEPTRWTQHVMQTLMRMGRTPSRLVFRHGDAEGAVIAVYAPASAPYTSELARLVDGVGTVAVEYCQGFEQVIDLPTTAEALRAAPYLPHLVVVEFVDAEFASRATLDMPRVGIFVQQLKRYAHSAG